jgi:hypothetical protein
MKANNINHYKTQTGQKAFLAERYIKTLKQKLYFEMDKRGTLNWIDLLKNVVLKINNTPHSRMKFIPNKINKSNEKEIYERFYSTPREYAKNIKFKIGDKVRVSDIPHHFRRAFKPYFTPQVFTIAEINKKEPPMFRLVDSRGDLVKKSYYTEQLQKAKYPDVFLVEKIIARRGNKSKVKWLGYDESYNSWVNNNEIYDAEK